MDEQQFSRWRPTGKQLRWAVGIIGALVFLGLVVCGYHFGWKWTGLVEDAQYHKRTLWDWLQLLIIPAVLAGVGLWFNSQQQERQREAEHRRTQDGVLQAYLEQMGQLLLDKDKPLSQSKKGDEVSTLARSLTLTALSRLDGGRKGILMQFLSEARLIQGSPDMAWGGTGHPGWAQSRPTIELTSADLSGIDLSGAALDYVLLSEVNLSGANLRGADLSNAILYEADLTDADLFDATVPQWRGLNSCKSLKGATMPNGQKYEDWRKDKKAKEKDEKNE